MRARFEEETRRKANERAVRAKVKAEKQLKILKASAPAKKPAPRNVGIQVHLGPQSKPASFGRDGDEPNRLTSEAAYIRDNGM